jgi:hypothetical protein
VPNLPQPAANLEAGAFGLLKRGKHGDFGHIRGSLHGPRDVQENPTLNKEVKP